MLNPAERGSGGAPGGSCLTDLTRAPLWQPLTDSVNKIFYRTLVVGLATAAPPFRIADSSSTKRSQHFIRAHNVRFPSPRCRWQCDRDARAEGRFQRVVSFIFSSRRRLSLLTSAIRRKYSAESR